jgi:hypothetical protein
MAAKPYVTYLRTVHKYVLKWLSFSILTIEKRRGYSPLPAGPSGHPGNRRSLLVPKIDKHPYTWYKTRMKLIAR